MTKFNYEIIPFELSDAHIQALSDLDRAVWPDNWDSAESWGHFMRSQAKQSERRRERYLVQNGEAVIGMLYFGESDWNYQRGRFYVEIRVHPDHQLEGLNDELYAFLEQRLAVHEATSLKTNARDDKQYAIDLLKRQGFELEMYEPESKLDVAAFDAAPFADVLDKLAANELRIVKLPELQTLFSDWADRYYAADMVFSEDIPRVEAEFVKPPKAKWMEEFEHPEFSAENYFFALNTDNQIVGVTQLYPSKTAPEVAYTGFTGVSRDHRRKGVATALKLHAIAYAKSIGVQRIQTENEENNPMLQINVQLGFEECPGWGEYVKTLDG